MIAVIGGTGFIGNAIAAELAGRGQQVVVISQRVGSGKIDAGGVQVERRAGDVTSRASLQAALKGVDTVVGAAQFKGFPNENPGKGQTFERVDHLGTVNAVAAALANGVQRYVYLSGAGAAPDGRYVWLRAKWEAERAIRDSGLAYCIIRPSWVYGRRDRALNRYVGFINAPLPVVPIIGDGKQRLQPVFVQDVARAAADGAMGKLSGVYEIGGPQVLSMDDVVRTAEEVLGKPKPLVHQPVWLMKALFSPKVLIPALPLPLSPQGLTFATMDAVSDTSALLRALPDFRLTSLRDGLSTYLGPSRSARASAG